MQPTADPKLLPPPEMARGMPCDAAREVQGRLLAGLGQRGDRVLVSSSAGAHAVLGDIHRAQHTRRLARRLPLRNSSVPGEYRPGGAAAHGAAPRIATVAAALLLDRAIPSIPSLRLTGESTQRQHGRVRLAAAPKLLLPPEMSRGIPYVTAGKVQGRPLSDLEQ